MKFALYLPLVAFKLIELGAVCILMIEAPGTIGRLMVAGFAFAYTSILGLRAEVESMHCSRDLTEVRRLIQLARSLQAVDVTELEQDAALCEIHSRISNGRMYLVKGGNAIIKLSAAALLLLQMI